MAAVSLILNGELDLAWLSAVLPGSKMIYCTDGAYDRIKFLNIDAVIGDMDSIKDKNVRLIEMPDQNYTDFEKALQYLSVYCHKLDVYGASGKEMDHFLGNLSVAKKYKDEMQLRFLEHEYYYFLADKGTLIDTKKGKTISILPFPKVESITTEGLEYELKEATLELGSLISIRNRAIKDKVKIQYKHGCALLFVYA